MDWVLAAAAPSSRPRVNSVSASAVAESRHQLNVWNSSTVMGSRCSCASSVTAWQRSP